jgi:pantoate--beta-alanine ligase
MKILRTPEAMHAFSEQLHQAGKRIALIPTLGNLHAGHLSLIEAVKPQADARIVSIFVNPLQFGPNEDFARYPRTLEQDCALLADQGVDAVFAPELTALFPDDLTPRTLITVPQLSDILCGQSRPGHFQGVATIVCTLFQIIQPDLAIFGEKDYQQLCVIRRMVADLYLPTRILSAPIYREPHGLAMSSRNQYLNPEQREKAGLIYQTLQSLVSQAKTGAKLDGLIQEASEALSSAGFKVDYLAIRCQDSLDQPSPENKRLIALIAAYLGNTRLIDNLLFEIP